MKFKKFLSLGLIALVCISNISGISNFSKQIKVYAGSRQVYLDGTYTDNIAHSSQSGFNYPSTVRVPYYDNITGKTYQFNIPFSYVSTKSTQTYTDTWISYGRAENYDRYNHQFLGYMSDNTSTYYEGSYNYSSAPRTPTDYYGPSIDKYGWTVDWAIWDENQVMDAQDPTWAYKTKQDGYMWKSDTKELNRYRKGVRIHYSKQRTGYVYQANYGGYVDLPTPMEDLNDVTASGKITFTPNSSAEVSIKNNSWANKTIPVTVAVSGDTVETKTSNESRSYHWSYTDSHSTTNSDGTLSWYTDTHSGDSSTSCEFAQKWKIGQLHVTGSGTRPDGSSYGVDQYIEGTSGIVNIDSEVKDLKLNAVISRWDDTGTKWYASGDAPDNDFDYWNSNTPSSNTPKPTADYNSSSSIYNIDITKPKIDNIDPKNVAWTNKVITVPITISDNFSGLDSSKSAIKIVDKSYYKQQYTDYKPSSSDKTPITTNLRIDKNGIYQIEVGLEDIAGNVMDTQTFKEYLFDNKKPYDAEFTKDTREYIDDNLTVDVKVGDDLSGVTETKWILDNNKSVYSDKSQYTNDASKTTQEQRGTAIDTSTAYNKFSVNIKDVGEWYIHVYQRDRAGNETFTTSPRFVILRLSPEGKGFSVEPLQMNKKVPRGCRFDIIQQVNGLTETQAKISVLTMTLPAWVDNAVEYRDTLNYYSASTGVVNHPAKYYTGQAVGNQKVGDPTTSVKFWLAYIPPFGTPITVDRNGNIVKSPYNVDLQLEYKGYPSTGESGPSKTHKSSAKFDVVPEPELKTEITNNPY